MTKITRSENVQYHSWRKHQTDMGTWVATSWPDAWNYSVVNFEVGNEENVGSYCHIIQLMLLWLLSV